MAEKQSSHRGAGSRRSFPRAWKKDCLQGLGQLHQLLGFKKTLEVPHLPDTNGHKDERLQDGPPQHSLVGALAGLSEALLPPLLGKRIVSLSPGLLEPLSSQLARMSQGHPLCRDYLQHQQSGDCQQTNAFLLSLSVHLSGTVLT